MLVEIQVEEAINFAWGWGYGLKWEWNEKQTGFHRESDELSVYQIEKEKKEEVKEKKILTCKDGKRLNKCSGIGWKARCLWGICRFCS